MNSLFYLLLPFEIIVLFIGFFKLSQINKEWAYTTYDDCIRIGVIAGGFSGLFLGAFAGIAGIIILFPLGAICGILPLLVVNWLYNKRNTHKGILPSKILRKRNN